MADNLEDKSTSVNALVHSAKRSGNEDVLSSTKEKRTVRQRLKDIVWDSLDYSPDERRFISKIDFFIL